MKYPKDTGPESDLQRFDAGFLADGALLQLSPDPVLALRAKPRGEFVELWRIAIPKHSTVLCVARGGFVDNRFCG